MIRQKYSVHLVSNLIFVKNHYMQFVLILHSLLRWAVLLFGVWTLVNALSGVFGKRNFTTNDNRSNLFFMICCDIQLLIGLILYFSNGWLGRLKDLGSNMKDPYNRFFTMEHMSMMILAWVLVHVGRAAVKKAGTDAAKHKKMLIFFGAAILLILASIPWPFREAIAKPLLRWF
jgi:hypothetical protein